MVNGYYDHYNKFYTRFNVHYKSEKYVRNTTLTSAEKGQIVVEKSRRIHSQVNQASNRYYHREKLERSVSRETRIVDMLCLIKISYNILEYY